MQVSHEAIYQALYVQGRGALRRELAACLRTGRAVRKPRRRPGVRGKRSIPPEIMISERPPEVEDRAVPGHWEGDLIVGSGQSAIGTLVERKTRFVMLVHLPRLAELAHGERGWSGRGAEAVRDALAATITTLPHQLRQTLTWDQGSEMYQHVQLKIAADIDIYFCDPHSPWQRGTNENTNGLLRQYFPKGTDLAAHSAEHLAEVAAGLNGRPRNTQMAHTSRGPQHRATLTNRITVLRGSLESPSGWTCQMHHGLPHWTPPGWLDPPNPRRNTAQHHHLLDPAELLAASQTAPP
ncbi:MAG: hypothetical protein QOD45_1407 [Pseudonocardiales bacterium]|nr:hypothetical protein [Pseudonocardiales bacterium]